MIRRIGDARRSRSRFRPLAGTGRLVAAPSLKNKTYVPPDGAAMIVFVQPEYIVFGDPCHWETTPLARP